MAVNAAVQGGHRPGISTVAAGGRDEAEVHGRTVVSGGEHLGA
jgi:hypothetical protein